MFNTLNIDEKRLIVQLPYRVGLYISESDQTGGNASDEEEARVLENLIHGFAQDVMGAESIQHIISTTIMLKDQWPEWGADLDAVPSQCRKAIKVMEEHVGPKDARAYANQLYEIGEAVALAFKEYEEGDFVEDIKTRFRHFMDQIQAKRHGLRQKTYEEYISISADEREALKKLARGLQLSS